MKTKLISIFILLFATHLICNAQDIYHLKYKSPDKRDTAVYDAYFSVSGTGVGFVRITPFSKRSFTAELDIEESYAKGKDGMPDQNFVVYEGKNPRIVKGDMSARFAPVIFWFKINADNFYDPWAVTLVTVKTPPAEKNFISVDFIKNETLSSQKELVSGFFADTSVYYRNTILRSGAKGALLLSPEEKNAQLFLVVVASTNDTTLQPNCLRDARKVINTFSELASSYLGLRQINIHIDSVIGNNYSKASVEAALRRIRPTKNDLVIFYYSGHGFHKNNSPKVYPFFDLRDPTKERFLRDLETQVLNVQDIYDTIIRKGARFNLVISDCCNDTVVIKKKMGIQPAGHKGGLPIPNGDNLRALFFSKQPVKLLMTAASVSEEAVVTPSFDSYFTFFFLQSMITYLGPDKGFPTWNQVFTTAKSQTSRQVSTLPCTPQTKCPLQTPTWLVPGIR